MESAFSPPREIPISVSAGVSPRRLRLIAGLLQITTNDLRLMLRLVLAGGGITIATQETFRPYIESGKLVSLLDDFLPQFPGFYLYFPQRRNIAPKLRTLIDYVKEWRQQLA